MGLKYNTIQGEHIMLDGNSKTLNIKYNEILLLLLFIVLAAFFIQGSFKYGGTAGQFPRLIGSIVLFGSLVLLFRHRFPNRIKPHLLDPSEKEKETTEQSTEDGEDGPNKMNFDGFVTLGFVLLYVLVSYLIGILLATPLFTISYMYYFDRPVSKIALVTGFSLIFGYFLGYYFGVAVNEGLLIEVRLW